VTAGLAVGGSFGAFVRYVAEPVLDEPPAEQITTGWQVTVLGVDVPPGQVGVAALNGIPLTVGGVLAVVAAILLVLPQQGGRVPGAGRGLAVVAAGLVIGTVAAVWLDLVLAVRSAAGTRIWGSVEIGTGSWTILSGALLAVVAGGVAAASAPMPTGPAAVSPPSTYPAGGPSASPPGSHAGAQHPRPPRQA
jgi:hypothetical protein